MAIREKSEVLPTLKVEVKANDENGIVFSEEHEENVYEIEAVKDIETRYDDKTIIVLRNGDEKVSVFVNATSMNNLIEAFGSNDDKWKGQTVKLKKEVNKKFNKDMIVIYKA